MVSVILQLILSVCSVAKISKYISLATGPLCSSAYEDTYTALKHGKVALEKRITSSPPDGAGYSPKVKSL